MPSTSDLIKNLDQSIENIKQKIKQLNNQDKNEEIDLGEEN
jgi:hypothetical protein